MKEKNYQIWFKKWYLIKCTKNVKRIEGESGKSKIKIV